MVSKKTKTVDHNIENKSVDRDFVDEYLDVIDLRVKPMTVGGLQRMAHRMIAWAKRDDALRISQFFHEEGISQEYFDKWCERSPALNAAKRTAYSCVADRREIGSLTRLYDRVQVNKSLYRYDKNDDMDNRYHAQLKALESKYAEANNSPTKYVVIKDMPEIESGLKESKDNED